ncbi:hypothetical protein CCDG5_0061 [[Clostridium] cellulosi]|uniref:Uncharacterized protein n=1 Tax=[Clostridium] cellulosi TaxID=29343 RepID=A0A078KL09_9FIRM|nr:hypothetical protein CCDG5_0061 [[Clostridium] cellulosi]
MRGGIFAPVRAEEDIKKDRFKSDLVYKRTVQLKLEFEFMSFTGETGPDADISNSSG